MQDLLKEGVIVSTVSLFNNPICPVPKLDGNKWYLTVVYPNLNTIIPSIKVPISNIIDITDSTQSATAKYYAVIDLANMFSSLLILTAFQLKYAFPFEGTQYTFTCLPMGCFNSPAITFILRRQDLNCIAFSPGTQVWHHTDYILLWGDSKDTFTQEIQTFVIDFFS